MCDSPRRFAAVRPSAISFRRAWSFLLVGVLAASAAAAAPGKQIVDRASGKELVSGPLVASPRQGAEAPDDFPVVEFTNAAPITINDATTATPYPSNISVAGVSFVPSRIQLRLNGLSHTFPGDVAILVVGPSGAHSSSWRVSSRSTRPVMVWVVTSPTACTPTSQCHPGRLNMWVKPPGT